MYVAEADASGCRWLAFASLQTARVDSNSTRTESRVVIRSNPEGRMEIDATKAADHNGYQRITRPTRGMQAGLKILCSFADDAG
jgi:hypothetical protein